MTPMTAALRRWTVSEAATLRASRMFSTLTRRTNSGCAAWWSKVVSTSFRIASAGARAARARARSASRMPPYISSSTAANRRSLLWK